MEIFIGYIVKSPITNKSRFSNTIREIEHFVKTHKNEIEVKSNEFVFSISPKDYNEKNFYEITFPKNCNYLFTSYFKIGSQYDIDEGNIINFAEICWESMMILKENFTSKIELYQCNLHKLIDFNYNEFQNEIIRRELNYFENLLEDSNEILKQDEIEDIFSILKDCIEFNNYKGIKTCLSLLNSQQCPPYLLVNLKQNENLLIENLSKDYYFSENSENDNINPTELHINLYKEYKDCKILATTLFSKIANLQDYTKKDNNTNHYKSFSFENNNNLNNNFSKFDEPKFSKSSLFQLKESEDIERITFILNNILTKHINKLDYNSKLRLNEIFVLILDKYCRGDFGIDNSYLTKYCIFHNCILKYSLLISKNEELLNYLLKKNFYENIGQILEEGVLNISQNIISLEKKEEFEKDLFFNLFGKFIEEYYLFSDFKNRIKDNLINSKKILENYLGFNDNKEQESYVIYGNEIVGFYKDICEKIKSI